jgi:hypothetical protein
MGAAAQERKFCEESGGGRCSIMKHRAQKVKTGALELLWVHNVDERKCRGIKPSVFMAFL